MKGSKVKPCLQLSRILTFGLVNNLNSTRGNRLPCPPQFGLRPHSPSPLNTIGIPEVAGPGGSGSVLEEERSNEGMKQWDRKAGPGRRDSWFPDKLSWLIKSYCLNTTIMNGSVHCVVSCGLVLPATHGARRQELNTLLYTTLLYRSKNNAQGFKVTLPRRRLWWTDLP